MKSGKMLKIDQLNPALMITCKSVAPLNKIHKRQPVIIEKENWETWLSKDTSPENAYQLLKPNNSLKISRIDERFNKLRGVDVGEEVIKVNHT